MQTQLELGKEYPTLDETEAIKEIEQISVKALQQSYPENVRPVLRDAHPKHHGCVKAEFIVNDNIPAELKIGIFKEPRSFTAGIRFSNNKVQDDTENDVRGMAIKLFGVEGEKVLAGQKHAQTQDFLLINHPVFFLANLQDYVDFFQAREAAKDKFPYQFFFSLNPSKWHLREFIIGMQMKNKKVSSPLTIRYWSSTPYKLGAQAVKYSAKPSNVDTFTQSSATSPDYLRQRMSEHLNNRTASFDFLIQLQTDAKKMPIEDPTVEWKSPFYKVATIKIPQQNFDTPTKMNFCENLSFTPWHSLPEHQPLGGINRARKRVYESIANLRRESNHVSLEEPTEEEFLHIFGS